MKIRLFILLFLPIFGLLSCAKDEPAPQVLKISEHNLHFSGNGGAWLLTINSNTNWQITGTNEWCTVNKNEGNNTDNLIISVTENDTKSNRSTNLKVVSDFHQLEISVQQDTISGEFHYELPVVFHIIYSNEKDTLENVKPEVIARLIQECNQLYRNNNTSVDMNLELVPATIDKDGKAMSEPGVHRILRSTSARQNSETFLGDKNTKDGDLLWNPNQYVNVFVFTFTETNVLGRTTLPHTPRQNSLIGLQPNNTYYTKVPLFPWGITLNNTYIYEENASKTLAHELGHYLGLLHVFNTDCSAESDYCDDTPNYNRTDYENWLAQNGDNLTTQQKYQRQSCEGIEFTSYNIMDYDYSYMDRFTADQFLRIRHVLEHSPLIPGPKDIIVSKGWLEETEVPEVRTME